MTVLDVRRKRIGLLTDLVFISPTADTKSLPLEGGAFSGYQANSKTFFVDPELYVRLLGRKRFSADVTGGARFWRLDNGITLLPGTLAKTTVGQTQSWIDPVVGARFRLNMGKGWFTDLTGDAGGFGVGSQQTWQVYGGIGKTFKEREILRSAGLPLFGRRLQERWICLQHAHERGTCRFCDSLQISSILKNQFR